MASVRSPFAESFMGVSKKLAARFTEIEAGSRRC